MRVVRSYPCIEQTSKQVSLADFADSETFEKSKIKTAVRIAIGHLRPVSEVAFPSNSIRCL